MSQKNLSADSSGQPKQEDLFIVGIGASAGGLEALIAFFEQIPANSGLAYVVLLHLSSDEDLDLAAILQGIAQIPVTQVVDTVPLLANQIYLVPPDRQLKMDDGQLIALAEGRPEERRAPIDMFLRTLADAYGTRAFAVILSGTGANGSMGLKRIKEQGGTVFVQNPRESAFPDMPRQAIATGLVDATLPVAQIPVRLIQYQQNPGGDGDLSGESDPLQTGQQSALREIFTQLRLRTGHDFSAYKRPTLLRRIDRRTKLFNLPDLSAYVRYLREHPEETQALLKDLLISVTNFFRDPPAFIALNQHVLSQLLRDKGAEETLRIWVAGCATGEEAYSVAMLCAERIQSMPDAPQVQIFATDIDEAALATARQGLYTLQDAADVSPERLHQFFTQEGDQYRIRREIREMILFAPHNVLTDPPFSRLDLISCRNLLIYLGRPAQERVMACFHFALKPGGYLLLGGAETPDGSSDLFVDVSREDHLYQSRSVSTRHFPVQHPPRLPLPKPPNPPVSSLGPERPSGRLSLGDLHLRMLEQYAAPSLIVNEEYDILHVSERAGRYLQLAGGELSRNLLQLIRPELRLELHTALYQAVQQQAPVKIRHLIVNLDDQPQSLTLHVRPVPGLTDPGRGFILILFEPADAENKESPTILTVREPVSHQLEDELIRLKAQLRTANEQHEVQAEELKASNEELQAINEELRAAAEELETSQEELQSINEELITVNQELKVKVDEVSLAGNNLRNLINSTDMATLFLDRGLRVNLFTPATRAIFNLIPADLGRSLSDITNRLEYDQLSDDVESVLASLQPLEREVQTTDGRTFMMRVLPYRTGEDHINGVVLTFVDITERRAAQEAKYFLASIVESSQDSVLTVNFNGIITSWNRAAEALYGYPAGEAIGRPLTMLILPQELAQVLSHTERIKHAQQVEIFDTVRLNKDGRHMHLEMLMSPVKDENGRVIGVSTVARDITGRKQAERVQAVKQFTIQHHTESLALIGSWEYDQPSGQFTWSEGLYALFDLAEGSPVTPDIYLTAALEADQPIARRLADRFKPGAEPFEEVLRIQTSTGVRTLQVTGVVIPEEMAVPVRLLGITRDITQQVLAREQIQESAENLQAVLDASPASIGLLKAVHDEVDPTQILDFRLVVGNQKLTEFLGQPLEELLGESADRFSSLLWDSQTLTLLRQVYNSGLTRYDEKRLSASSEERWLGVAVSRQDDGLVLTGLDITELKQIQAQQQHWLSELEQATQSTQLVSQLRDSLRDRGELLRAASHDLRGQVGIIATAAHLLGMDGREGDRDQIIQMIQRNTQQMTQLMTNLLDFSRLEAGREVVQISQFDVGALLAELAGNAQAMALERGLWLRTDGPLELMVDSDALQVRRMAQNLVLNALKYTQDGGVTINWSLLEHQAGWQFSVTDTGPGLSPVLLSRLQPDLDTNESAESAASEAGTSRIGGEGIGLMIVQQLSRLLGGTLDVESKPGIGTRFVVRFKALLF